MLGVIGEGQGAPQKRCAIGQLGKHLGAFLEARHQRQYTGAQCIVDRDLLALFQALDHIIGQAGVIGLPHIDAIEMGQFDVIHT